MTRRFGSSPKEFDLILFLARHQGIALSRDLILERVLGLDVRRQTVARSMSTSAGCAKKLRKTPATPRRILTVRGIGYRFDG